MVISFVAMAADTLIIFLDAVFELIEERIWFIYFSGLLSTVSVHYFCFSEKLRKKALIANDDVIVLMTSSNL